MTRQCYRRAAKQSDGKRLYRRILKSGNLSKTRYLKKKNGKKYTYVPQSQNGGSPNKWPQVPRHDPKKKSTSKIISEASKVAARKRREVQAEITHWAALFREFNTWKQGKRGSEQKLWTDFVDYKSLQVRLYMLQLPSAPKHSPGK